MIQQAFPEFQLEDKLAVIGGGNDRNESSGMGQPEVSPGSPKEKIWKVYVRKKKRDMSKGREGKGQ